MGRASLKRGVAGTMSVGDAGESGKGSAARSRDAEKVSDADDGDS